jgi:hypothetical protein
MRLSGFDQLGQTQDAGLEAWRVFADAESYFVAAEIWLTPVFAQGAACIAVHHYVEYEPHNEALSSDATFHWFEYWLGSTEEDCQMDIVMPDQKVHVDDPIATDAIIIIMRGSTELLASTLEHPKGERFRARQTEWRIRDISIHWNLDTDLGFAYVAEFEGNDGVPNGPLSTFTMRGDEFVVHDVGAWAY